MIPLMRKIFIIVLLCLLTLSAVYAQTSQTYQGHLDDATETQSYSVTLNAGDAVVAATSTDGTLDTVVTLYNAAGDKVAENDDTTIGTQESSAAYLAQESGTYSVTVSRYDASTSGDYTLTVTVGDSSILRYDVTLSGTELTRDS